MAKLNLPCVDLKRGTNAPSIFFPFSQPPPFSLFPSLTSSGRPFVHPASLRLSVPPTFLSGDCEHNASTHAPAHAFVPTPRADTPKPGGCTRPGLDLHDDKRLHGQSQAERTSQTARRCAAKRCQSPADTAGAAVRQCPAERQDTAGAAVPPGLQGLSSGIG